MSMNEYVKALERLKELFSVRIAEVESLVQSDAFAKLSPKDQRMLFTMKLQEVLSDCA